jgi:hypothetical protein
MLLNGKRLASRTSESVYKGTRDRKLSGENEIERMKERQSITQPMEDKEDERQTENGKTDRK